MMDLFIPALQYSSILAVPAYSQVLDSAELKLLLLTMVPLMVMFFSKGPKFGKVQMGTVVGASFATLVIMFVISILSPKFKGYIGKPKENRVMGGVAYTSMIVIFMIFMVVGGMLNTGNSNAFPNVRYTNI